MVVRWPGYVVLKTIFRHDGVWSSQQMNIHEAVSTRRVSVVQFHSLHVGKSYANRITNTEPNLNLTLTRRKSYFQWRVHWNFVPWSLFSVNGFTENAEAIFYFQWRVHWNYGHWNLFSVNGSLKYRANQGIGVYFQWIASPRMKLK